SGAYERRLHTLPPFSRVTPSGTLAPSPPLTLATPLVLGEDCDTGVPVTITARQLCEHLFCVGKTGQGKTVFIRHLAAEWLRRGGGLCLVDVEGPLTDDVVGLLPPEREGDAIYLDLSDAEWPFGYSLFDPTGADGGAARARRIGAVIAAFQKVWGGTWGIQIQEWLTTIGHTFLDNRRGTMADIPRLLTDAAFRRAFLPRVRNNAARVHWQTATNPRARDGALKTEEIGSTLRRISLFLSNPLLENIVGQERTTLAFDRWIAERKVVLLKLPVGEVDRETVHLIGTLLVQDLLAAALRRPEGAEPFLVIVDECQAVTTPDYLDLLTRARKRGVGVVFATQKVANIPDAAVRENVFNVGAIVAYETTGEDGRLVARELRGTPFRTVEGFPTKAALADALANLRQAYGPGVAVCKLPGGEHRIRVPLEQPADDVRAHAMRSRIRASSRRAYCRPRWEVEREIRERGGVGMDERDCDAPISPAATAVPGLAADAPPSAAGATQRRRWITPPPESP
ncbi:MAG: type IV secretory system conjugative DNA transfer family protein, partial [Thermomicrobiales bacterium]